MNRAAPDGGGGGLAVEAGAAAELVSVHAHTATRITDVTGAVPDIDGGLAQTELLTILTLVLGTANALAVSSSVISETMQAVTDHLDTTDAEVAAVFAGADTDPFDGPTPQIAPQSMNPTYWAIFPGGAP